VFQLSAIPWRGSGTNREIAPSAAWSQDHSPTLIRSGGPRLDTRITTIYFWWASLFYAGRIYGQVGAFSQLTYNGVADCLEMDNTDIRFADDTEIMDTPITYGISLNITRLYKIMEYHPLGISYTGTDCSLVRSCGLQLTGAWLSSWRRVSISMINNLCIWKPCLWFVSSSTQRGFGIPLRTG